MSGNNGRVTMRAGAPAHNPWMLHAVPFAVGDPAAFITFPGRGRVFILREIEMDRAKRANVADFVHSPKDFAPAGVVLDLPEVPHQRPGGQGQDAERSGDPGECRPPSAQERDQQEHQADQARHQEDPGEDPDRVLDPRLRRAQALLQR